MAAHVILLATTPVTDQLTDVSSVDVMIARVVGVVLAIVIAGLILLLLALFRRVRTMASTLGQRPDTGGPADDGQGKTIAAMTSISVEQGNEILESLKFNAALVSSHFAQVDATLAERGPILDRLVADVDDLKSTRHEQGERIGHVEGRVAAIEARLESATCLPITPHPITPRPTTGD